MNQTNIVKNVKTTTVYSDEKVNSVYNFKGNFFHEFGFSYPLE